MTHPPLPPSDELWLEMVQLDTPVADGLWDGQRTPGPLGPGEDPRWREDVARLVETARGPAEPSELADEAAVVAVMHATRTRLLAAASSSQQAAPARVGVATRPLRAVPNDSGVERPARGRPPRTGRGKVRMVGRVVVAKGVAAVGTVGFGVAAAAATTGIVASGIVATLVAPALVEEPPAAEPPATPGSGGGGVLGPGADDEDNGARVGSPASGEIGNPTGAGGAPNGSGSTRRPGGSADSSVPGSSSAATSDSEPDATSGTSTEATTGPVDQATTVTTPGTTPVNGGSGSGPATTTSTSTSTSTSTTTTSAPTASTQCAGALLSPTPYSCGGTRDDPDGGEVEPFAAPESSPQTSGAP